jgi:hypothetical protein
MTRQDKPMPPDQRLRVVAQLRKFLAANKDWSLSDVYRETGVSVGTLYAWTARKSRKPYAGANIEALAEFLERRGYYA